MFTKSLFSIVGMLAMLGSTTAAPAKRASSSKMGISWAVQEKDAAPLEKFFASGSTVSWWYDWNKNWNQGILTSSGVTLSGEFVPMLFNPDFLANNDAFETGWTEIMGFNEPDLTTGTGVSAYVEPSAAAATWKTQITKLRAENPSAKIYSPAMAFNMQWLETFFANICPGESASNGWGNCAYKPDYLAMHMYTTDTTKLQSELSTWHTTFGLPVVLSEFACYDFSLKTSPSASDISAFMSNTTKWLNKQDWVVKYAWFGAVRDSANLHGVSEGNRLMDASGGLTALGKQYIAGGAV